MNTSGKKFSVNTTKRRNTFILPFCIALVLALIVVSPVSAASLNLNMGGSFKFADSFLDTMVSCSGGKGATQLNWNEYYQNDNTQERIISGTSAGKEYQEIQYKETWGAGLGTNYPGTYMEYVDRGGNRWVRIRVYDVKGNLVDRYDSYNGDEIASSISDGIFPADFATAGTQPTPDEFARALDNLRISTCGGVAIPQSSPTIDAGNHDPLTDTIDDQNGNQLPGTVNWVSSDPAVATVDSSGVVTGVSGGVATITAQDATNPDLFGHSYVTVQPSSPAPATAGMQLRNNANRSGDYSAVAGATGTTVSLCWSYSMPDEGLGPGMFWFGSSPVVENGMVYVGDFGENTYALNATTGALTWRYDKNNNGGSGLSSTPAIANGVVYIGNYDGSLIALNATSGAKIWSFGTLTNDGGTFSPAVANGVVYVGGSGYDDNLYALNAATGEVVWSYNAGAIGLNSDHSLSDVAVANGLVYIGHSDFSYWPWYGSIYAFNAATGNVVWSYDTTGTDGTMPTVANGVVYVVSTDFNPVYATGIADSKLYALNANTGNYIWSYTFDGKDAAGGLTVANGMVYVGANKGNIYALNAATGVPVWTYTTGGQVYSSPAVANGVVYVGSEDDNVYALNVTTGNLIWKYKTGDKVDSSPAVANGVVYVGSNDGNLYALYTNPPPMPTVTSVSPNYCPPAGGNSVTITGTGFTGATRVMFGATPASFTVTSNTEIAATSPAGTDIVDITVTNPSGESGTSDADLYSYAPIVTGVSSPAWGSSLGGNLVTITGNNFDGATGVSFGDTAATWFNANSDTEIVAKSPAGSADMVDITVTNPGGESETSDADLFVYGPTVATVSPVSGPTGGGNNVTITGSGFTGATNVTFGTIPAISFTVNNDTRISAEVPDSLAAGSVDITVSSSGIISETSTADRYTYTAPVTPQPTTQIGTIITSVPGTILASTTISVPASTTDPDIQASWGGVTVNPASGTSSSSIATTTYQNLDPSTLTNYQSEFALQGLDISSVYYVVVVTKTNVTVSSGPANITMSVPTSWYNAQGGSGNIRVVHTSDTGTTDILTVQSAAANTPTSGYTTLIFNSPLGLSTFTLVSVMNAPVGSSSSGSDSGSSSSVGGSSAATASSVTAGQTTTFSFNQNPSVTAPVAVSQVQITPSQSLGNVEMTAVPANIGNPLPGQTVAGYIEITPIGINPDVIGTGVITFSVNGQWLSDHGVNPANIVLMRDHNNQWTTLPTTFDHQTGNAYYFDATTPGFSYYAIVAQTPGTTTNATMSSSVSSVVQTTTPVFTTIPVSQPRAQNPATTKPVTTPTTIAPTVISPIFGSPLTLAIAGVIGIVILIGVVFLVRRWWIRRQNPALFREYD
ncbi:PQQ-binding-like beta-propeller repeat protein [Methanoregula sp.]|jgi:PGF-pre-PGF domain-containing protein|uniref:outer membrane protein assembly factor BamB family protein n=1 Tax=Methanoregula sp. TaxID=2052170 RepID=UPI0025F89A0C|nr:PQQ-binding-like beta-propeller repeat protein [Methanoregula sp.]